MRLALIAPWVVAPPIIGGLQIRFYQLQSLLARLAGAQGLAVWDLREGGPVSLEEPPLSASDPRRPELAAFVPSHGVRALGLRLCHLWPGYVAPSLADQRRRLLDWLAQQQATHVVLVHPYASELAPVLKRRGLHVFIDCHNVESELALQLAELAGSAREAEEARLRHLVFRRRERRCFPAADEVWLPSEEDVCRQQQVCGAGAELRLRVVPNALDLRQYEPPRALEAAKAGAEAESEAEETLDIVYPAEFGYGPNVEAAVLLSERILPAVRRCCPRARLVLVGRDRYGLVACLCREPEVVVTDTVPDVRPYLARAAVVPVPLRHGSGTRYKILEALALERPVVTTPRGAEGLALRDGEHVLVREPGDFDEAIVTLLRDRQLARQLGRNGRRLVEARYSWEALEPLLRAALEGSGQTPRQGGAC